MADVMSKGELLHDAANGLYAEPLAGVDEDGEGGNGDGDAAG